MNKGTLTIFSNTNAVLGLPAEPVFTNLQIARFTATVQEWLEHGGVMHLPFPVDVVDLRPAPTEIRMRDDVSPEEIAVFKEVFASADRGGWKTVPKGQVIRSQYDLGTK